MTQDEKDDLMKRVRKVFTKAAGDIANDQANGGADENSEIMDMFAGRAVENNTLHANVTAELDSAIIVDQ